MFAAAIENPVARGAAKAYEAILSPEVTELHAECATRAVLAHVEGWTDDLAARDELTRRHLKANAERIKRLERMFAEGEL